MNRTDSYKTIASPAEGIFTGKGSKFIAYAFPVFSEEEIKEQVARLRKEHHKARHHCFAWRLGADMAHYRANDDGEPSGSAGKPIFGQIRSYELTNILVVVVRYFGGTLLGVPGLINAYRKATIDALENATIAVRIVEDICEINFDYLAMNNVMQIIKEEGLEPLDAQYDNTCTFKIPIRQSETGRIVARFQKIESVKIKT